MKIKKILNKCFFAFAFVSALIGIAFLSFNNDLTTTEAGFTVYDKIQNNLPQYLSFDNTDSSITEDKSIVLMNSDGTLSLNIADTDEIEGKNRTKNPAYKDPNNPNAYYYFDFTSSLSLYKNVTNQSLEPDLPNNLLATTNASISDFAKSNDNGFVIEGYSFTPKKFNINFKIGSTFSHESNTPNVTVTEGLYTLVIPMTVYYTYDNGLTFSTTTTQIEYTFMLFNSNTYFNSSTGLQNATFENVESVSITNSIAYSMYHYYNYTTNTLPKFSYNPYVYQISINYTDNNDLTHYAKIEFDGEDFNILNADGQVFDCDFVMTNHNQDNSQVYLTFNEIGKYDINFEYLYLINNGETSQIFLLPFEELNVGSTNIRNLSQRLYLYGYQTVYTNHNKPVDQDTNQLPTDELKTISSDQTTFDQSADITYKFLEGNATYTTNNSSSSIDIGVLQTNVETYLNNTDLQPIITNQVPIKFLSNVEFANGKYYKVENIDGNISLTEVDDFTNENQNVAGKYVYIIQYQFKDYMGEGGIQQSAYYHFQIFYFEVTNEVPSVKVVDYEGNDTVSLTRYTNKSVYIVNESTKSPYNANVTIQVEVYDYSTGRKLTFNSLKELAAFDSSTYTYHENFSTKNLENYKNKEVVFINSESTNANRKYTLKYFSTMNNSNSYTFTIDTNQIEFLSPRTVTETSSGYFAIENAITSNSTNNSFVFQWQEKASGAVTYGYVKQFPLEQIEYYKSGNNDLLIYNLLAQGIIPVSYKINFANGSSWSPIQNTISSTVTQGTNVKSDDGLYLLEVYDQAGNVGFYTIILESTQPVFIKKIEGTSTEYQILQSSDTISVVEEADVTLCWGDYKAIILQNYNNFSEISSYEYAYTVSKDIANDSLYKTLTNFVSTENDFIKEFSPSSGEIEESLTYNSKYFVIEIDDNFLVKDQKSNTYISKTGNSYQLELFKNNGDKVEANEGTCQIIVRDASNTKSSNEMLDYPSGKISLTITSDSSQTLIQRKNTNGEYEDVNFAGYSLSGMFYEKIEDGERVGDIIKEKEDGYTESSLAYKYMYYTPSTAKSQLRISFIPIAFDGAEIKSLTLKYYPYTIETQGNFYYYNISSTPTNEITIYDSTKDSSSVIEGAVKTFDLALGTNEFPLNGRYVITRIYDEQSTTSKYDFYERTLTIDVDSSNLISQLEQTESGNWESLIGGEIVLSMYSGEGQSSIQVSFPFDKDGNQNNDSFYNGEWTNDMVDSSVSISSVSGNKLPMMLYIPKYKYTMFSSYVNDNNENTFEVTENNNLSYYGNAKIEEIKDTSNQIIGYNVIVEGLVVYTTTDKEDAQRYLDENLSINQYEIYATIEFAPTGTKTPTIFYKTNKTTSGGYLDFYAVSSLSQSVDDNATKVNAFSNAGTYTVTLYQAKEQGQSDEFYRFYKFSFEITSQKPNIDIYDNEGLLLNEASENIYYTNSPSLSIEWEIPTSEYIAKIDESNISISYYSDANSNMSESLKFTIQENGLQRKIQLDLNDKVAIAGSKLHLTMQYEGYNSEYYDILEIDIFFDVLAPTKNISSLMDKFSNSISNYLSTSFQNTNMCESYDYLGNKSYNQYAYSYTINSGTFRGFSYTVDQQYLNQLIDTVKNSAVDKKETQNIYYKFIGNSNEYISLFTSPTTKENFVSSSFNIIDSATQIEDFYQTGVYEIVEFDSAGNMVSYLINYINDYQNDVALEYSNNNNALTSIANENIQSNFNIYSNTGFTITKLNYQNNPWSVYKVQLSNGNGNFAYYISSPTLGEGYIYKISKISSTETNFDRYLMSQMFDSSIQSSSLKHALTFNDSLNGMPISTFVTIMDANLQTEIIKTADKNSAVLDIYIPTSTQVASLTNGYVYPTNIKIERYDENGWTSIVNAIQEEITYGTWNFEENIGNLVSFSTNNNTLRITVKVSENTKIKYTIIDNFGNQTTLIQIANEVSFNEVTGSNYVYKIAESGNETTYLADKSITYSYNSQLYNIKVEKLQNVWLEAIEGEDYSINKDNDLKINSLTFNNKSYKNYNFVYKLQLFDAEDNEKEYVLKTIYIKIYNSLPEYITTNTTNNYIKMQDKNGDYLEDYTIIKNQKVTFNEQIFTTDAMFFTTYSENVTLRFSNGQNAIYGTNFYNSTLPYSVYISKDSGYTWENINDKYEGCLINGVGNYQILIKYDSSDYFTSSCKLIYLTIVDSSSIYYYVTVDGVQIEKSNISYTNENNKTFEATYFVSVDYNDKLSRFDISWNEDEDLNLTYSQDNYYPAGDGVYVEEYSYNCKTSSGNFAVIFIPVNQNFVTILNYEDATGSSTQITGNSATVYASNAETNFDKLKINFRSYYGIEENKIIAEVYKYFNGEYKFVDTTIYKASETTNYIYLEKSGSYRIIFKDSCTPANIHKFGNNDYLTVTFLNEVPFVISYQQGEEIITSEKIQNAVYNSPVTISLYNLSNYFQASGYPVISVKRNGLEYEIESKNNVYTFTEPGYYSVKFSATTLSNVPIRETTYNFTIINSNESRYAYSFANYKNYYVKSVIKDGVDITQSLIAISNFDTTLINNKEYLSEITLSYNDEKTGQGRYTITICSNQDNFSNILTNDFSFDVWINNATPPIDVSIKEGASTTSPIIVTVNMKSFYEMIGDSYIVVGNKTYQINADTISTYDEIQTFSIENEGTWYIQVYSSSGNLLYSYKVYKTAPLNAFSIIAIITAVIVLLIIIIITIKLRKRQRVK